MSNRKAAFALALVASWACSEPQRPPTSSVMPDSVDQVVYGFVNHITVEGVERVQLEADSAFNYPSREVWELFNVRVRFRSQLGQIRSTLTAREGTYEWRTGDMEAREDVVAVTPDGRRLETCSIIYDQARDEVTGPCAFVFRAPNEELRGESFTADPDFRNVVATRASGVVSTPPDQGRR